MGVKMKLQILKSHSFVLGETKENFKIIYHIFICTYPWKKWLFFKTRKTKTHQTLSDLNTLTLDFTYQIIIQKLLETLVKKPDDCQNIFLTLLLLFCILCATLLQTVLVMGSGSKSRVRVGFEFCFSGSVRVRVLYLRVLVGFG